MVLLYHLYSDGKRLFVGCGHYRLVLPENSSLELSNTMDTEFCLEALQEAMDKHGNPDIFNTDQVIQFTSPLFTQKLKENGIKISMDGKGYWVDNVVVQSLWRSLKYEDLYLKVYETSQQAEQEIGHYFQFYNERRRHQDIYYQTPIKSILICRDDWWHNEGSIIT